MAHTVTMPKFGLSMESATVLSWAKEVGDRVTAGEAIAEVETDKITNAVEAPVAGTLREILVAEGEEARVGAPLCVIE